MYHTWDDGSVKEKKHDKEKSNEGGTASNLQK